MPRLIAARAHRSSPRHDVERPRHNERGVRKQAARLGARVQPHPEAQPDQRGYQAEQAACRRHQHEDVEREREDGFGEGHGATDPIAPERLGASCGEGAGVAPFISKSASLTAPRVASAIFTAKRNEGWRWPYAIFRMVFSGSSMLSANVATEISSAFR